MGSEVRFMDANPGEKVARHRHSNRKSARSGNSGSRSANGRLGRFRGIYRAWLDHSVLLSADRI